MQQPENNKKFFFKKRLGAGFRWCERTRMEAIGWGKGKRENKWVVRRVSQTRCLLYAVTLSICPSLHPKTWTSRFWHESRAQPHATMVRLQPDERGATLELMFIQTVCEARTSHWLEKKANATSYSLLLSSEVSYKTKICTNKMERPNKNMIFLAGNTTLKCRIVMHKVEIRAQDMLAFLC